MSWDGRMYKKYRVAHTDGTPLKGKSYFVLRLDSDNPAEAARVAAAMRVYKGRLRNCDVGTAEEQCARWRKFCDSHSERISDTSFVCNCPCKGCGIGECELAWAQMPYEAQEGAGK